MLRNRNSTVKARKQSAMLSLTHNDSNKFQIGTNKNGHVENVQAENMRRTREIRNNKSLKQNVEGDWSEKFTHRNYKGSFLTNKNTSTRDVCKGIRKTVTKNRSKDCSSETRGNSMTNVFISGRQEYNKTVRGNVISHLSTKGNVSINNYGGKDVAFNHCVQRDNIFLKKVGRDVKKVTRVERDQNINELFGGDKNIKTRIGGNCTHVKTTKGSATNNKSTGGSYTNICSVGKDLVHEDNIDGQFKKLWKCQDLDWKINIDGTTYRLSSGIHDEGYKELRFIETNRYVNIHTGEKTEHSLAEEALDENTFLSTEDIELIPLVSELTVSEPIDIEVEQGDYVTKIITEVLPGVYPNSNLAIISSSWMARQASAQEENIHLVQVGYKISFHPDQKGKVKISDNNGLTIIDWIEIFPFYLV